MAILDNVIRTLRTQAGLTQEQLAEKVKVTRVTINSIERGQWMPSTILAIRIARVFGVPVESVFILRED